MYDNVVRADDYLVARNKETGVVFEIRPGMLNIEHHPWEVLEDHSKESKKKKAPALKGGKQDNPNVVTKASGVPFGTEESAKAAMTKKKLSEDEWVITPVQDGFIITKV